MSVVSQIPPPQPPTRAADLGWGGSSALGTGGVAAIEAGWGFAAGSGGAPCKVMGRSSPTAGSTQ